MSNRFRRWSSDFPRLRSRSEWMWVEAVVPVRSAAEVNYILLGRRKGGRRYLSEDLRALARLAGATAERVENLRTAEMLRLVSQAEFRALQSQINPHFLFNALNALYGIIPRKRDRCPANRAASCGDLSLFSAIRKEADSLVGGDWKSYTRTWLSRVSGSAHGCSSKLTWMTLRFR